MESSKGRASLPNIFITALKSAILALIISLLLSVILCGVAFATPDPLSLVFPLSLVATYSSSFVSGFACMKKVRQGLLMCGLISGGILMLLYAFISLFLNDELSASHSLPISLLLHSLIIIFSLFGAYAARNKGTRRRKPKR